MTSRKTLRYIDAIPDFLYGYNSKPHSSLGYIEPRKVTEENKSIVYENLYGDYLRERRKRQVFQIGDRVRIAAYRKKFKKSSELNFTEEIFEVVDILNTQPPMYCVKSTEDGEVIRGAFYAEQMQKFTG